MFCINCGAKLPDNAKFCLECGSKVGNIDETHQPIRIMAPETKLVAANCTNCGAALQVDSSLQAAVCPFCNTPYIVEKAIQNFNITNNYIVKGANVENLLSLADNSLKAGKFSEASSYADRALETDPTSINAWIYKILAAGFDIEGDRSSEISSYVESALDNGANDEDEIKIYEAVLDVSIIHIEEAIKLLGSNKERIQKQLNDKRDKRDIAAMDSGYIAGTTRITNEAIEYRNIVPYSLIVNESRLQEKIKILSKTYNMYYEALIERLNIYNSSLSTKAKSRKQENLKRILEGVDSNVRQSERVSKSDKKKNRLFGSFFS